MIPLILPALALQAEPARLIVPPRPALIRPTEADLLEIDPALAVLPGIAGIAGFSSTAAGGGATWQTIFSRAVGGAGSGGWNGFTLRVTIPASDLSDITGTELRLTMKAGSGEGLTITKTRVGLKGSAVEEFASTPANITWSGGSASVVIAAGASAVSDPVTFSLNGSSQDVVFAWYTNGGTGSDTYATGGAGSMTARWKAGDDVDTVGTLSGYTNINANFVEKIEVFA